MDLKTIRARFIEATGRADLQNADGSDNGANQFINAGQRFLDGRQTNPGTRAAYNVVLPAGTYSVVVPELRYAEEVWISSASGGRILLQRKFERELRQDYPKMFEIPEDPLRPPSVQLATLGKATPKYWSPMLVTVAPGQRDFMAPVDTYGQPTDTDGLIFGESWARRGIMIAPPSDEELTFSVRGGFWSPRLVNDADSSWWSMVEPAVLTMAAAYILETFYRNTTGAKAWLETIVELLRGIRADEAMAYSAGITGMEN